MTRLVENALFGTALILAAALLRRVLKGRLLPEARLALWAACLLRLLAPVFPVSGLSLWGALNRTGTAAWPPRPVPGVGVGELPELTVPGTGTASPGPVEPAVAAFPWEAAVLWVWIGAGVLLAARYVLSWNRTRRAVAEAIPLGRDDPRYVPLPRCARLREGVMEGAPLTFGAVRPTVVLSPGLSGAALECVLAHEGVHARRRDNLWHYAMALALVVYWWDPAVWLMARLLRRDIELACDRAAVRKLGAERRAEYAETLVAMATAGSEPAFCRTFGRKAAEERIVMIMKYRKTTIMGVVLSLMLVAGVTAVFASGPKGVPDEDSTTSTAPSTSMWSMTTDGNHGLRYFSLNLDYLEQSLNKHVADGSMTRKEADRIVEQARALSGNGVKLEWVFQENSGLVEDSFDEDGNYRTGFNIFYKDEDGKLTPVDPATVVSGFILPAAEENGWAEVVVYRGRAYNRADLSAETLEWLDWYLALPEEERLAVSYEPAELRGQETPDTQDAGDFVTYSGDGAEDVRTRYRALLARLVSEGTVTQVEADAMEAKLEEWIAQVDSGALDELQFNPAGAGEIFAVTRGGGPVVTEFVPDYDPNTEDSAGAGDDIICGLPTAPTTNCGVEGCTETRMHQHSGEHCAVLGLICPVEGCTIPVCHDHDGVTYYCNGAAHPGGVCDGSCRGWSLTVWNEADITPTNPPVSSGHHSDSHHGSGHHGGHH